MEHGRAEQERVEQGRAGEHNDTRQEHHQLNGQRFIRGVQRGWSQTGTAVSRRATRRKPSFEGGEGEKRERRGGNSLAPCGEALGLCGGSSSSVDGGCVAGQVVGSWGGAGSYTWNTPGSTLESIIF